MATFVLAAILITLAVLALLIWPLLFTRNTFSYARQAQNIHYAKERLAELEEQLKNASISATDYEALKLEIETTLAQDIDLANNENADADLLPRRPNKLAIGSLALLIPLGALFTYSSVGTPEAFSEQAKTAARQQSPQGMPSAEEVQQMIVNLEKRLEETPDDLQGWAILSRTYLALGEYSKAANGLKRVLALGGESADIYATLADATALAAQGNMAGEPTAYADKALQLNPNNRQALWLRGLAAVQNGNQEIVKQHWGRLLTILQDQPQQQAELREIMAEALGGGGLPSEMAQNETQVDQENAQSTPTPTTAGVTVSVSISEQLTENVSPEDLVFVFARAANGPPPPLAVKRIQVKDLPIEVTLSDQDAMMPQLKMSLFEEVVIVARVSKSGQPVAKPGDLQSPSITTKSQTSDKLKLEISQIVE